MNLVPVSNLESLTNSTINDSDKLIVQTSGNTKKITASDLKSYCTSSIQITTATAVASGDNGYTTGDQVYNAIESAIGMVLNTEF